MLFSFMRTHTREARARARILNTPTLRIAAPIPAAKKQTAFISRLALRLRLFFDMN